MFLFETFEPGKTIGSRTLTLSAELLQRWLTLFPDDHDGERMPPGMTAAVYSRAYSDILQPRPPGNVHGQQLFTIAKLPVVGDTLVTELRCEGKELKGERRWVRFASETRRQDGTLMFSGLMTTLWAK
ncbi:MaoC family dehydratase [uncultured Bradyrhizobium sp.]|uniref:MaoC family dehydratase n=1 Tax=Bradyrhizobium sp. TaxID=376 RepID=UPI0026044329|nr:MaoC family dehydratase [uncultured Bradyrhizobium sp.]